MFYPIEIIQYILVGQQCFNYTFLELSMYYNF